MPVPGTVILGDSKDLDTMKEKGEETGCIFLVVWLCPRACLIQRLPLLYQPC